jgi:ABC-type multidrug transport system fused ATPase/permease subunit
MARRSRFSDTEDNIDKKRKLDRTGFQKALKLFGYTKPYRKYFWIGMIFLVVSTLTTLTFPTLSGKIADVASGDTSWLLKSVNEVALVFFGILFLQAVASFFRVYLFANVSERTMADLRASLYNKIITLPVSFFEKNRVGDLISRVNTDISQLESMLSFGLAELFRQVAVLTIGVSILLIRYTELALVMLATFPVMIIVAIIFGKFIRKLSKKAQDELATANTIVEETFQAIQVVKIFTNEFWEQKRYRARLDSLVKIALKTSIFRGIFVSFLIFALFGGIVLVLWYGAGMIAKGTLKTGELIEFILYTIFIGASVAGMGDLYAQLQKTLGASERILEILGEQSEVVPLEKVQKADVLGDIWLQDVQFAYPTRSDVVVLKSFNLHIAKGEKVALVGHSGAGKSTVAQLIMKLYPFQSGNIWIDGVPIQEFDATALRANIAFVPQELFLFGGTIRENIAYGKPNATDAEIREAARRANALDFIERFPDKFETIVGERGIKLSGGQRQRIAIARAILKNPSILILDEATSALDAESEKLVQDALNELMKDRTTIIIAHRLATIRNADKICVLNEGRIVEEGTHEELISNKNGIYHNLVRLQLEENFEQTATPSTSIATNL